MDTQEYSYCRVDTWEGILSYVCGAEVCILFKLGYAWQTYIMGLGVYVS